MRQMNRRLVIVGGAVVALAIVFFLYMMSIASKSNDPKALLETVGQVSGVGIGVGIVLMVFGFLGKKPF